MFSEKILCENPFFPEGRFLVDKLYKRNPEVKKFRVQMIKFALSKKQRLELLNMAEIGNGKNHFGNDKHFAMIKTQLEAGLRVGELVNLPIKHVNLNSREIEIKTVEKTAYTAEWHPKTTKSQRPIPITPELCRILKRIIGKRKEGYVFESRKKNKDGIKRQCESSVINMIDDLAIDCKSIRKTIGSHALRRSYASFLINDGVEIGKISQALGHNSIKTTMLYLYNIIDTDGLDTIRDSISKMNPKSKNNDDLEEEDE